MRVKELCAFAAYRKGDVKLMPPQMTNIVTFIVSVFPQERVTAWHPERR